MHFDYASDAGYTIRFGADEFGISPADGTTFACTYRTGPGARSNVAAGTITYFKHPLTDATDVGLLPALPFLTVSNPLPVTDGVDPETLDEVRQLAPEEFRAVIHRAVATVELTDLMNCVRQAGREVHVLHPRYRAVDLEVTVCVKPGHLPSDVRDRVLLRLRGDGLTPGYFNPDSFIFGMPIHRLTLEAVIGAVPGVLGVRSITIAARGHHLRRPLEPLYRVPDNQILRLANDPRTPERGSVKVFTEGGV